MTPDYAWTHREGRNTRYDNKRVGGTVCVHFIKKNMWYLETALTFLEMQDTTELEMQPSGSNGEDDQSLSLGPNQDLRKSGSRFGLPTGLLNKPDPTTVHANPTPPDIDEPSITPTKVLLVQPRTSGPPIHVEGGGTMGSDPVIIPVDEFDWPEEDRKRGGDSDVPGGQRNQASPLTGHFANGSKRVNKR